MGQLPAIIALLTTIGVNSKGYVAWIAIQCQPLMVVITQQFSCLLDREGEKIV